MVVILIVSMSSLKGKHDASMESVESSASSESTGKWQKFVDTLICQDKKTKEKDQSQLTKKIFKENINLMQETERDGILILSMTHSYMYYSSSL